MYIRENLKKNLGSPTHSSKLQVAKLVAAVKASEFLAVDYKEENVRRTTALPDSDVTMPHSATLVARKVPLDSEADAEKPLASLSRTNRLEEQELKLKQQQSDAESRVRERERERLPPAPSLATMLHDLGLTLLTLPVQKYKY
jgi:hypothetical protein